MTQPGPGADAQRLAEEAAIAALQQMDVAQQFGATPPGPAPSFPSAIDGGFAGALPGVSGALGMGPMPGMYAPPGYEPAATAEKPQSPQAVRTLEDLYATYPQIGDGQHYLRVERLMPKTFMGQSVAGYLDDLHEKPSLDEFRERYGGTRYQLTVFGPKGTSADGQPLVRRLHSLEVTIPGPPALGTYPRQEDMMSQRMPMGTLGGARMGMMGSMPGMVPGMPVGVYQTGEPIEIALKRLEHEEKERERREREKQILIQQSSAAMRPPDMVIEAVRAQAERNVDHVRMLTQQQIDHLAKQVEDLQKELRAREQELDRARQLVVEARREAAEALRYHETEQMAQLKQRFEQEMRQQQDQHTKTVERLTQDHRDAMAVQAKQFQDDRARLLEAETRERQRSYEDMKTRVDTVRDDAERRAQSIRDQYEARITDLQRQLDRETSTLKDAHSREIASLRDTHARELQAARLTEETKAALSKETSGLHVQTANERLARMEAELGQLRRENEELRDKAHKDPLTLLRETKEIASSMLGMVDPKDVEPPPPDTSGDWKTTIGKGVADLFKNAPIILQTIQTAQQGKAQQQQ